MKKKAKGPVKPDLKKVQEALDFARKLIGKEGADAEGFMVSIHTLKAGRVNHTFSYNNYPLGDWGNAMIAVGNEAKRAQMLAGTGRTKV